MAGIYEKLMIKEMPISSQSPISFLLIGDHSGLARPDKPSPLALTPKAGAVLSFIFHFVYFHILLLS